MPFFLPGPSARALAALLVVASVPALPSVRRQSSGTSERLRGVSAVSSNVAWASGAKGTVLRTTDGGATWNVVRVPRASELDFRDIEAFDADVACILSIGPGDRSRIYKTTNGGRTWTPQFTNTHPKAFYDDIAFWDAKTGIAAGDPVDGRFTFLRTTDGGRTWWQVPAAGIPPALPGEAAFAASGSALVVNGKANAWFGTGGAERARVFRSVDQGLTWEVADTPVCAGAPSAGIFSLAFADARHGIAVGGDYRKEAEESDNLAATSDGGRTWTLIHGADGATRTDDGRAAEGGNGAGGAAPADGGRTPIGGQAGDGSPGAPTRLRGYRSGVVFVPGTGGRSLLAVGPAGMDWSADGGVTWLPLGKEGFDTVRVTRKGTTAWVAGSEGRIARLDRLR